MKNRFFYWLKIYFGFSNKESLGFVFLIPVLLVLGIVPMIIRHFKTEASQDFHIRYLAQLDSLTSAGADLIPSPFQVFNPQDTLKNKSEKNAKLHNNLNKIPFSEADSVILQIVPGIGQSTASRIIKFRENMGGLYNTSQLNDVYGLKPETADLIWDYFTFTPGITKKIQINQVSQEELSRHPYVSYAEAKVLIAYRTQHGRYELKDDLLKIRIFKPEWVERLAPYLDFE